MLKDIILIGLFLSLGLTCIFIAPNLTSIKPGYGLGKTLVYPIAILVGISFFGGGYHLLSKALELAFKIILAKCPYRVDPSLNQVLSHFFMAVAILQQLIDLHRIAIQNRILREFCKE